MSREAANEGIKNFLWITKGTFQFPCKSQFFPHEWVSRRGEKKFHHEPRSGEWWNFYLPQLLGHEWGKNCDAHGNWNVPWVMNREFSPSQIPKMIGFTFLLWKWKFHHHQEWLISKVFTNIQVTIIYLPIFQKWLDSRSYYESESFTTMNGSLGKYL